MNRYLIQIPPERVTEETPFEALLRVVKYHLKHAHDGVVALYFMNPETHGEWALYHAMGLLQNKTYATWMTHKSEKFGLPAATAEQLRQLCAKIGDEYPTLATVEAVVRNLLQWTVSQLAVVGY